MVKRQEKLTPRQFVKDHRTNINNIQSVKIVPPKLGQKGFGKITVVRKSPVYPIHKPAVNE